MFAHLNFSRQAEIIPPLALFKCTRRNFHNKPPFAKRLLRSDRLTMSSLASRTLSAVRTVITSGGGRRHLATSAAVKGGDGIYVHRDTPENNSDMPFEFTAENK